MRCLCHRQRIKPRDLALHADVSVGIRRGPPDHRNVYLRRPVIKPLPPVHFDELYKLLRGTGVESAARLTRVDIGVEAGMGKQSRLSRGRRAQELAHRSLRQTVCLDLVAFGHLRETRRLSPVASDGALHQSRLRKRRHAPFAAVAEACGVPKSQVFRLARFTKTLGETVYQLCRFGDAAARSYDRHYRPVLYHHYGLPSRKYRNGASMSAIFVHLCTLLQATRQQRNEILPFPSSCLSVKFLQKFDSFIIDKKRKIAISLNDRSYRETE